MFSPLCLVADIQTATNAHGNISCSKGTSSCCVLYLKLEEDVGGKDCKGLLHIVGGVSLVTCCCDLQF